MPLKQAWNGYKIPLKRPKTEAFFDDPDEIEKVTFDTQKCELVSS